MAALSAGVCICPRFRHAHGGQIRSGVAAAVCRRLSGGHAAHDWRAVGHSDHAAAGAGREPLRTGGPDPPRQAGAGSRPQVCVEPARHAGKRRDSPLQLAAKASATFVVEILHNLRDQSVASTTAWRWLQTRLQARGQSPDELLRVEQQREAIDQLSIANIISTMRVLSALDWPTFVEGVSRVERILRRDPAGAYADMDRPTRDRYRKSVEQISRRSGDRRARGRRAGDRRGPAGAAGAAGRRPRAPRRLLPDFPRPVRAREERSAIRRRLPNGSARLAFRHPALGYLGVLARDDRAVRGEPADLCRNNHGAAGDDCARRACSRSFRSASSR